MGCFIRVDICAPPTFINLEWFHPVAPSSFKKLKFGMLAQKIVQLVEIGAKVQEKQFVFKLETIQNLYT